MVFGGSVLSTICNGMINHEILSEHYASLYDTTDGFDNQTIKDAFSFYVKVYSNLRLKDLCRKYNSLLHKTTTVGLRQSLATRGGKTKRKCNAKPKKRARKKQQEEPPETEEEIHNALEEIAAAGISSADDEREEDNDTDTNNN